MGGVAMIRVRDLERRDRVLDLILGGTYFIGLGLMGIALSATFVRGT
jgi:hypothetical protein